MLTLSVIVPVYSGEKYIRRLVGEVEALRTKWQQSQAPIAVGEMILVDDSAIDTSPDIIDSIAAEKPWVVAIHLSRNYGQHPATMAGILHSSGDWVVTLDEDLQHPPAFIESLLSKAAYTHADIVYAKAEGGVHQTALRDVSSRTVKKLLALVTGNKRMNDISSFRLLRGAIARAAAGACAHDTYFDASLFWFSQRVQTVQLQMKDERFISTGTSGYRLRSLISHARRLMFSGHMKFLRFGALLGFAVAALSGLVGTAAILVKLTVPSVISQPGWTSLFLTICFFGGLILTLVGILLEYISILVLRAHGKPLFFIVNRGNDAKLLEFFREPA